jgi:hypothetical protein
MFTYSEHEQKMNTNTDVALTRAAIDALCDLGIDGEVEPVNSHRDQGIDGVVTLTRDGKTIEYVFQVKRSVTRSFIGPLSLAFGKELGKRLLVTDYVNPLLADELRRRHVQFIDAAGNAYLDRRGLLVFVAGRRDSRQRGRQKAVRAFRGAGLKVGFVLVSMPDLASEPQRTIASTARVALGSVAAVLEGLRELGFIADVREKRRLLHRERLLDQWTEAYARQFFATLEMGRFSGTSSDWWRHTDLGKYGAQWGGETAAALLQGHLVPEQTIIYADEMPAALLKQHRLRADASGSIVLRRRFWNAVPAPRSDVVPPLLIYADLVSAGDARSLASAKQVRDAYLV